MLVSFPDGNNTFVLRLRNSKTDPFSKGIDITIFENVSFKQADNFRDSKYRSILCTVEVVILMVEMSSPQDTKDMFIVYDAGIL